MSSQSLILHLLRLLHLFLQGLPRPLVQSPPLLLSPSLTSQTWLLYPRKRNCNKARRLHALGNWEPVKNSYTGHPGRTLCGFRVSINYRHMEEARRDQLHCDPGSVRTGAALRVTQGWPTKRSDGRLTHLCFPFLSNFLNLLIQCCGSPLQIKMKRWKRNIHMEKRQSKHLLRVGSEMFRTEKARLSLDRFDQSRLFTKTNKQTKNH